MPIFSQTLLHQDPGTFLRKKLLNLGIISLTCFSTFTIITFCDIKIYLIAIPSFSYQQ